MSEEQTENVEAEVTEAPAEAEEKTELPKRDDGTYVDFNDVAKVDPVLAKRAEKRLGWMNARMKSWETQALEQAKVNKTLISRLEKLETSDFRERMDKLQARKQEAYESGDMKKVAEIDDELIEYRIAEKTRKPTEVKEPEFPKEPEQPLDDEQMATLASWARETDDSGKALRPWANPSHPQHEKAIGYIQAAAMDPDYDVSTQDGFQALLEAVDRKMSRGNAPKTAAVLSGNGDGRPPRKGDSVKLSPEALRVAESMNYTPEAYAKLMKQYNKEQ